MPVLEKFICPAGEGAGFIVPLFRQRPGANLLQIQKFDQFGRVIGFEDIAHSDEFERLADDNLLLELGSPGIWAFLDAEGNVHAGGKDYLCKLAPDLLTSALIRQWPASAADLIRFCELEEALPEQTRHTYTAMIDLLHVGAAIWRDTDLILPMVRQQFGTRLDDRSSKRSLLSSIWANSVGDVCHIYCPDILLDKEGGDLSSIARIASAWGISRLELHPQAGSAALQPLHANRWLVAGHGGVGRWTVRKMWNAVGPHNHAHVRARMGGRALEGQIEIPRSSLPSSSVPPHLQIVIHGSAPADLEASTSLYGAKPPGIIRHVFNIRPLGIDPERRQAVPARSIVEAKNGPDYVWVIANHRPRRIATHYVGLARSQVASRYARAGVSALVDLSRCSRGRSLLQETERAHALGLVGAARFLANMAMPDLLLRVLYSMLSPEWSFADCKRIVCLWPHPLPDGTIRHVRLGHHHYPVELLGLTQSSARADIRCLAFGVTERRECVISYADYIASVMAAWNWDLRSDLGEEMLFEEQGGVILMLVADTPARLDNILQRDRYAGPFVDIVVTNRRLTSAQLARAEAADWIVVHHSDLPRWVQQEFGEPGQMPLGGRTFPVE